jgi:2-methylcitrate dehydratase PrpD
VSLPYSVAIALLEGGALPPQYQNDKLKVPEVLRLSELLKVVADDTLPRGVSCALEVRTAGGKVLSSQVDHPRGSIANPMTEAEMNRKVHMLGDPIVGHEAVNALIRFAGRIENLPRIDDLVGSTVPSRASA